MVPRSLSRLFHPRTIKQKLLLVAAIAAVPSAALLAVVLYNQNNDINQAQQEKDGIQYVLPLEKLLQDLQKSRDLSAASLSKVPGFDEQFAQSKTDVDNDFPAVVARDHKFGARFHTGNRVPIMQQSWNALKATAADTTPRQSLEAYTNLITTQVVPLLYDVSESSGLFLDTRSASYHAAIALDSTIPSLTEALGELRGYGVLFTADGGKMLAADRDFLNSLIGKVNTNSLVSNREVRAAAAADKTIATSATALMQAADDDTQRFLAEVQTNLLIPASAQGEVPTFYANASHSIDNNFQLSGSTSSILERMLNTRASNATWAMQFLVLVAVLALALLAILILATIFSITGRVSHLVEVADRISLGELDAEVDLTGKDELGELAESLGRMRSSLQAAIERLRTRRASYQ